MRSTEVFRTEAGRSRYFAAYDRLVREWPVTPESRFIETRFGRTHMLVAGRDDAPPLLLLSAVSVSAAAWFANIGDLAAHFRVHALDTIGDAGKSVLTRPITAPADFADWLRDVLDTLGLARVHATGHSYGAWILLHAAPLLPDRLGRIALLAPSSGLAPFRMPIRLMLRLARILPFRPGARRTLERQAARGFVLNEAFVALMEEVSVSCWPKVPFPGMIADAGLRRVSVPTLLLIGEDEVLYDPRLALERARRLMPEVSAALVPGASHLLPMEQPVIVNHRIVGFLTRPA